MAKKVKTIFNFSERPFGNLAEITFQVPNAIENPVVDWEERFFDPATLEIWSGSNRTGALLIVDTDYELTGLNEFASRKVNPIRNIYTGIRVINNEYHNRDLFIPASSLFTFGDNVDETDINRLQEQINEIGTGEIRHVGERYTAGYTVAHSDEIADQFDAVAVSLWPELFKAIGHIWNDSHVLEGQADLSGSFSQFYPTPVPGYYNRAALHTFESEFFATSTGFLYIKLPKPLIPPVSYNNWQPIPLKIKANVGSVLPGGVSDNSILYILQYERVESGYVFFNEEDAIFSRNPLSSANPGSGTFTFQQAGIVEDDAFQNHDFYLFHNSQSAGGIDNPDFSVTKQGGSGSRQYNLQATINMPANYGKTNGAITSMGRYGEPRVSDETRPKTVFMNYYTKASSVTDAEKSLVTPFYDTGYTIDTPGLVDRVYVDWNAGPADLSGYKFEDLEISGYWSLLGDGTDAYSLALNTAALLDPDFIEQGTVGASVSFDLNTTFKFAIDETFGFADGTGNVINANSRGKLRFIIKPRISRQLAILTPHGDYNQKVTIDLSQTTTPINLLGVWNQGDGFKIAYRFSGGDGTNTQRFTGGNYDGRTIGGVDANQASTALQLRGEGLLTFTVDGLDLIIGSDSYETDGGQFATQWEKYPDGRIEERANVTEDINITVPSGTLFNFPLDLPEYHVPMVSCDTQLIFLEEDDTSPHLVWVARSSFVPRPTERFGRVAIMSTTSNPAQQVVVSALAKGRWTDLRMQVG